MIGVVFRLIPALALLMLLASCTPQCNDTEVDPNNGNPAFCDKPVIYLYPKEKTDIIIELNFDGELNFTYPEYNNQWKITAYPDATLVDKQGKKYSYLFWDGEANTTFNIDEGFCVSNSGTVEFLEDKLNKLGLSDKEINDFIVYWGPQLTESPYNLIKFENTSYTDIAKMDIAPNPDSLIRVFMIWKPCSEYVDIPEQNLGKTPLRNGYTIVEWGGSKIG